MKKRLKINYNYIYLIFLIAFTGIYFPINTYAQSCPIGNICHGERQPGQDTLRVLMAYVRFDNDNTSMSYWNSWPNPNNVWEAESWMKNSIDSTASEMSDNFFNLTNYFRTMSKDPNSGESKFMMLGDVVYITISSSTSSSLDASNKQVLDTLDAKIDLTEYDNFKYISDKNHEKSPDNILDLIYIIYRMPNGQQFGNFGGYASLGVGSYTLNSGLGACRTF